MNRPLHPAVFSLTVVHLLTASLVVVFITMENQSVAAQYAAVLALAYLVGSVPWGYILLRWRRGVDIREYGSGSTGMANVLRTGGGKMAGLVFALDVGKGILTVVLAKVVIDTTAGEVAAGLLALVGHNWPVFLQFRGGRGILTGLGGLWIMAPIGAAVATSAFLIITLFSRYVSVGNISGVIIGGFTVLALGLAGIYSSTYILYVSFGGVIIIWQHRANIQRIRQGTERRLGQPAGRGK